MSNNRATRPSPSESATLFSPGTMKVGNDGQMWRVVQNNGINRWVKQIGHIVTTAGSVPQPTVQSSISMQPDASPAPVVKQRAMKKSKNVRLRETQDLREIKTSMINKEEVFKMLALSEATGLPCLLVGPPGVGKTKTVIEYAKAWLNRDGKMSMEDFANKIFILETDEGTKSSEIKGMPDLTKLFKEDTYELSTPIADAEIVIINEVDKASSGIRNAMLGVMNEKFLFNGKHKIPCKWKLFIATCNEIPNEESGNPFWDRFMLKMTVNRVSAGSMAKYYAGGDRSYSETIKVAVPNPKELDAVKIPVSKLEKYIDVAYNKSSDRTLTFVPKLTKAVSYIWDYSVDKALVKTAQIMVDQGAASSLQNKLVSPQVKTVMSKIELLHSYNTNEELEIAISEIDGIMNTFTSNGEIDEVQAQEIEASLRYVLDNHPARKDFNPEDDFEAAMVAESITPSAV